MSSINPNSDSSVHQQYLTEDLTIVPFGVMLTMLRAQMFYPLALLAAISIKIFSKIKGRTDAINAVCIHAEAVETSEIPQQGRIAFQGLANQLKGFHWIQIQRRPCLGLRQQYEALALHEDGQTIAICEWQHHMIVTLAVEGEDPVKSTEAVTTEFVSFLQNNKEIATCHVPEEHMAAFALYDGELGEYHPVSNQERMEVAIAKHQNSIAGKSVYVMNNEGAIEQAELRGKRLINHFKKLRLLRTLLPTEVPKLHKMMKKHSVEFEPYTRL